jgi:hypothetical protein
MYKAHNLNHGLNSSMIKQTDSIDLAYLSIILVHVGSSHGKEILQYFSFGAQPQRMRLPTRNAIKGTVKLSSSSVLMGSDSTSAAAIEITRKLKAMYQLSLIKPKVWK